MIAQLLKKVFIMGRQNMLYIPLSLVDIMVTPYFYLLMLMMMNDDDDDDDDDHDVSIIVVVVCLLLSYVNECE